MYKKSFIEAEGDILIRGGVQGRSQGVIESTGGSIFTKFLQGIKVIAEKDLVVSEAIIHSEIFVAKKAICYGKRAQIVGGATFIGEELRAKFIGSHASIATRIVVGSNPKTLVDLNLTKKNLEKTKKKLNELKQNSKVLEIQLASENNKEKMTKLLKIKDDISKSTSQIKHYEEQIEKLQSILIKSQNRSASIHIENTLFPGVTIEINGAEFKTQDEYRRVSLIESDGHIKIIPYQPLPKNSSYHKDIITIKVPSYGS